MLPRLLMARVAGTIPREFWADDSSSSAVGAGTGALREQVVHVIGMTLVFVGAMGGRLSYPKCLVFSAC